MDLAESPPTEPNHPAGSPSDDYGHIVMPPASDQVDALLLAVKKAPVGPDEVAMHLVYIDDPEKIGREGVDTALALVASRWDPFTAKITDISKVYDEAGNFLCVCAVVDSTGIEDLRKQIIAALVESDVEVTDSHEVAFHIPLSTSEEAGAIDATTIINMELSFDEIMAFMEDDRLSHVLGSTTGMDAYRITQDHDECAGYALVRSEDEALISCHENETEARAALKELLNEEGDRQDEKLINLETEMTEAFTEKVERLEGAVAAEGCEPGCCGDEACEPGCCEPRAEASTEEADAELAVAEDETEELAEEMAETPADPLKAGALAQGRIASGRSAEFEGVLIVEGMRTGDRRYIDQGALSWRDLPLPLMFTDARTEGHMGSRVAGVITEIWREEGDGFNVVWGRGHFDRGATGSEAHRMLSEGAIRGVSADLDNVTVAEEFDENNPEDYQLTLSAGRVMGATLLPFPAFQEASIWLVHEQDVEDTELVAGGSELYRPVLSVLTELEVEETE